jgi:DNA polymerase
MLEEIEKEIKSCKRCELWKYKINYVPGEGNPKAKVVLIGEAPGRGKIYRVDPSLAELVDT